MNTYTIDYIGGMAPTQAEGTLSDGRKFYFRARHGGWSLRVSTSPTNFDYLYSPCIAEGVDKTHGGMSNQSVIEILDQYLPTC